MRLLQLLVLANCLATHISLIGELPEIMLQILRHLDFLDISRVKRVSEELNNFIAGIKVNWLARRYLTEDEASSLLHYIKQKNRNAVKRILGNGPVYLDFEYGRDLRTNNLMNDAIRHGTYEIIEILIRHGFTLNSSNYQYILATCMSCRKFAEFQLLLKEHPDLSKALNLSNILCHACDSGVRQLYVSQIRWLLDSYPIFKTLINRPRYLYPIHIARSLEVLRLLLEYGADPNVQEMVFRRTKLHLVMFEEVLGRAEKIKCLLEAGANASVEDSQGNTAVDLLLQNVPDEASLEILGQNKSESSDSISYYR